jgi:hypothetical protein
MEYSREYIDKIINQVRKGKMPVPENMNKATAALFWEKRHTSACEERGLTPMYNLGTLDHDGTVSMYQIYMQCATEYEAALVLLGSLRHWSMLLECKWFKPHIDQWRKDMALRDEAIGRQALLMAAAKGVPAAGSALIRDAGKRGAKPINPKERGVPTAAPARSPQVVSAAKEQLLEQAAKVAGNLRDGRG